MTEFSSRLHCKHLEPAFFYGYLKVCFPLVNFFERSDFFPLFLSFHLQPFGTITELRQKKKVASHEKIRYSGKLA